MKFYSDALARVAMKEAPKDEDERYESYSDEDVKAIRTEES